MIELLVFIAVVVIVIVVVRLVRQDDAPSAQTSHSEGGISECLD